MNEYALDMFRQMFLSLKRGTSNGRPSTAKPIFIISLIDSVVNLENNCFNVNDNFLKENYRRNTLHLNHISKTPLVVPFFHLHTEPFYELLWNNETRPPNYPHTPSVKQLTLFSHGAKLDDELWELLKYEENRQYLRESIINQYFSTL